MPVFTITMQRFFARCDACGKEVDITENPRDMTAFYSTEPRTRPSLPQDWFYTDNSGLLLYCKKEHMNEA